jgi:hypothetical protein
MSWVKKSGFRSDRVVLEDGTKVFLVGQLNADYLVLYLHGMLLGDSVKYILIAN